MTARFILLCILAFSVAPVFAQGVEEQGSALAQAEAILGAQASAGALKGIPGLPALTVTSNSDGGQDYSVTLQILLLMTALTFLPAILMMMTSFTRIIIVFSILRQALGLQQTPSNQIILGLSLFLSFFIMSPVLSVVNENALQPYIQEKISAQEAIEQTKLPFHQFMVSNTRESDVELFFRIGNIEPVVNPEDIPFSILMPAFVTSE